jgi:hypothetical protein
MCGSKPHDRWCVRSCLSLGARETPLALPERSVLDGSLAPPSDAIARPPIGLLGPALAGRLLIRRPPVL